MTNDPDRLKLVVEALDGVSIADIAEKIITFEDGLHDLQTASLLAFDKMHAVRAGLESAMLSLATASIEQAEKSVPHKHMATAYADLVLAEGAFKGLVN